ncbi:MAG: hypothetical protein QM602_04320 [Microbacterium sp.]
MMPTFFDSTADAAEASEALRDIADAIRTSDQPAQMYGAIGDLALATAEELRQSAQLVDHAYARLAEGFVAAGRIARHPEPAVEEAVPSRWINVVFLQGDEADRPLRTARRSR